jgi:hypothetical protein
VVVVDDNSVKSKARPFQQSRLARIRVGARRGSVAKVVAILGRFASKGRPRVVDPFAMIQAI